ncbi:MAG: sigma factor-like helix-turn-helix DNA-binding protein [Gemmataceae bacterium]
MNPRRLQGDIRYRCNDPIDLVPVDDRFRPAADVPPVELTPAGPVAEPIELRADDDVARAAPAESAELTPAEHAVVMARVRGETLATIAEHLGISVGIARKRLRRALRKLRERPSPGSRAG